jgi:hypothetical protein
MAIRNTRELAARLRQNAADCEQATEQVRPESRARLLKAAENYRAMADKIETSRSMPQPLATSLAAVRATADPGSEAKSSMSHGLTELARLLDLSSSRAEQTPNSA